MKATFLALCAGSILFLSCANDRSSEKTDTTGSPTFEVVPTPALDPGNSLVPPAPTQTTTTAAGLNPAHGQPGHRCDIAVGAPLNSAPSASATATPGGAIGAPSALGGPRVSSSVSPPSPSGIAPSLGTQTTATAPGMNPPHGQPGHDCAIAVGAPLKK